MSKKVILKKTDIDEYVDISDNFDSERLAKMAFRIQEQQLRELLGDALYHQLYNDLDVSGVPQNEPYIKLVNGTTYDDSGDTIQYFGLKPFLTFHWAAINVREGDKFAADYGNLIYSDDPQDNLIKQNQREKDALNASYMKSVTSYRNNIVKYLNDNYTDFPKWEGRTENKTKDQFSWDII